MEEKVQSGSGKLDELHQILNKTQQKLHKFKVSANLGIIKSKQFILSLHPSPRVFVAV